MTIISLMNKETGEITHHESQYAASNYIGRHESYISQTIRRGYAIRDTRGVEYLLYKNGKLFDYEKAKKKKATHAHKQLCFTCKNFCNGCSWARSFKPVEGWDATPTVIVNTVTGDNKRISHSYAIRGCPEYEEG